MNTENEIVERYLAARKAEKEAAVEIAEYFWPLIKSATTEGMARSHGPCSPLR